ncbi:radical SAM protein [Streptomyces sp. NPDC002476]|uniref:radical SAM protein n=1 Tax=Streptomyces sp. NPDC002476 TaxID=3364648 RepID=UPI00369CFCDD
MKYTVTPLPGWEHLSADDEIQVARHYRVPVAGGDVLLLPHGRPGWLRLPLPGCALLDALHGTNIAALTAWPDFAAAADTVRALYDAGLLFIGGRTGLRGVPSQRDGESSEPPTALLLKLTGSCDMACDYCYDYDERRWPGRMSSELARQLIRECLQPGHRLMLMFHGGEPMLRFRQIRDLVEFARAQADHVGAAVRFTIQTNGLHLDERTIDFLRTHDFSVGVSLDGPRDVHDRHRVDHGGAGTFDRIAATIDRFPEFMRREVGYISVVGTDTTSDQLERTWTFFRELGVLSWKLLPADAEGRADGTPETQNFRTLFVDFLAARLAEVLDGASEPPYITNLVQLIEPFLSLDRPNMCMKMPCGASTDLLVLDAVGAVRACDCTYHPAFQLLPPGRTALSLSGAEAAAPETGLTARSRNSPSAAALREREGWLLNDAPCASCPWLHQCAGTCPARALINKGSLFAVDDLECATRLALFPRILADVSRPGSALREYYRRARQRAGAVLDASAAPPR